MGEAGLASAHRPSGRWYFARGGSTVLHGSTLAEISDADEWVKTSIPSRRYPIAPPYSTSLFWIA